MIQAVEKYTHLKFQNVYLSEDVEAEPDFEYVPESPSPSILKLEGAGGKAGQVWPLTQFFLWRTFGIHFFLLHYAIILDICTGKGTVRSCLVPSVKKTQKSKKALLTIFEVVHRRHYCLSQCYSSRRASLQTPSSVNSNRCEHQHPFFPSTLFFANSAPLSERLASQGA